LEGGKGGVKEGGQGREKREGKRKEGKWKKEQEKEKRIHVNQIVFIKMTPH